MNARAFD